MSKKHFTSESITEGHPDKVCDQIADRILDELLKQDPQSRCACEVTAEPGAVHIMGEITTQAEVDYAACARAVIHEIGYVSPAYGFTDECDITCTLHQQSPDIAIGVDRAWESRDGGQAEAGAGDQGMMFGYATNETKTYMPAAFQLANDLTARLAYLRKAGILPYLRPDGKAQVSAEYEDDTLKRVEAIVVSAQHDPDIEIATIREDIMENLIRVVVPASLMDEDTKIYINPTGRFVLGGPAADTGLTGRKIIADTYGGYARHGGGAFSGKDPSKVDRSAAYMARYIAKHIVASGVAQKCEVQLGYSIGVANPVSISVDTLGTGTVADGVLVQWIKDHLDLRPDAIIKALRLREPIYSGTAAHGHFGKEALPWERLDDGLIASLKAL